MLLALNEKIRRYTYRNNLPTLLSLLDPKKDEVILDVGAGTGWIASKVAEHSEEVFALEPNEKRVEHIKTKHPEVKAFSALANSIPFPPNYFDKLFTVSAFHHFPDQGDALEEFRRVIKKGGLLLINEIYGKQLGPRLEKSLFRSNIRFLPSATLESLSRQHEFEKVELREMKGGYFFLLRNAKTSEHAPGWLGESVREDKAMRYS
jgi:SAM-dependent methyltransferase